MKKIFLYISALLAGAACTAQETLLSPDGRLRLEFSLADGGRPTYTLDYKERPVILPSGKMCIRDSPKGRWRRPHATCPGSENWAWTSSG